MVVFAVGLQIVGIVSVFSSLAVVLTLGFEGLRKKLFMQIIAWIALSDLIANVGYCSLRRPNSNTPLCSLEGFVNLYFYPVSWMWSTMLMVLLYSLATSGKLPFSYLAIHCLCWIFPFLLTIFNFVVSKATHSTSQHGNYSYEVCTLGSFSQAQKLYHVISYYGLWVACMLTMIVMYVRIRTIDKLELRSNFPIWKNARDTLILYPLALFVCWTPHVFAVLLAYFDPVEGITRFYFAADLLKVLHGTATALIFFYKSNEARTRWYRLFLVIGGTLGLISYDADNMTVVTDFSIEYETSVDHSNSNDGPSTPFQGHGFLSDDTMAWANNNNNNNIRNFSNGSSEGDTNRVLNNVGNRLHSQEQRTSSIEIV